MTQRHQLGAANVATYYYRQWQGIADVVDGALSNASLHRGCISTTAQRRTLRYRTGTLYTEASAAKFSRSDTAGACLLCGQQDSAHHSVSACPMLSDAAASRHNRAGRLLLQAIRQGSLGAYVVSADVGTLINPADSSLGRSIPRSLTGGTAAPTRPDIVLHVPAYPARGSRPARASQVICVELKYCCDYRPAHQQEAADSQHAPTLALLQQARHTAVLVPVLLGVSGTIFTDALQLFHDRLGLTKTQARALGAKLHTHATTTLSSIYGIKRSLDSAARAQAPPPPAGPT